MPNIWDSWWHHLSSKGFVWLFPFSNVTCDTGGLSLEHATLNTLFLLANISYTLLLWYAGISAASQALWPHTHLASMTHWVSTVPWALWPHTQPSQVFHQVIWFWYLFSRLTAFKNLVQAQTTCLTLHPVCLQNQHDTQVLLSVQDKAWTA